MSYFIDQKRVKTHNHILPESDDNIAINRDLNGISSNGIFEIIFQFSGILFGSDAGVLCAFEVVILNDEIARGITCAVPLKLKKISRTKSHFFSL